MGSSVQRRPKSPALDLLLQRPKVSCRAWSQWWLPDSFSKPLMDAGLPGDEITVPGATDNRCHLPPLIGCAFSAVSCPPATVIRMLFVGGRKQRGDLLPPPDTTLQLSPTLPLPSTPLRVPPILAGHGVHVPLHLRRRETVLQRNALEPLRLHSCQRWV